MKKIEHIINIYEYSSPEELEEQDRNLINKAIEAAQKAYAPYSGFHVGAAVLLENGKIIQGNNQENAAYPSGLCAERVALFAANAQYPDIPVVALAVVAFNKGEMTDLATPPCGACRQVMIETEMRFGKPIRVILAGKSHILVFKNVRELLPLSFTSKDLNL
jgi:cytidine deaminase